MRPRNIHRIWRQFRSAGASSLAIVLVTVAGYKLHFNDTPVVLLYLLVIVVQSLAGGSGVAIFVAVAAAACFNFFFLPPVFTFRIANQSDVLTWLLFLVIALLVTRLVSRMRVEAGRAWLHGTEVEQLYQVAIRLLVLRPDQVGGISALKIFRDVLGASAICLFDASTVDTGMSGISRYGLAERTRQAYISGEDADDPACGVFVRCLRGSAAIAGAIGFEGLSRAETISPALPVLAAQAVERAHAFRRASQETAAAQAEVFRTAILDALAHEFKTPLATILALIGGIRESLRFGPEQEEMAEMIESEVSRLSRLTTRLLRTARLDREELKPRVRRIDVVPFVERVAHRFQAHSRERRVVVDALSTSIEALGDPQLLALALTQLLDNAIKYSLQAGAVTVRVQAEEGSIAISVENEGNPIEPGEQERIFERFYRGARARNLVSGTGLGLYVARKIAAAHGGTLDLVNGAARHGVIFCLKLPTVNHEDHALVSSD